MKRIVAIAMALLLVMPIVVGFIYVKPADIRFREGGVFRLNDYFFDPRVQYKKTEVFVYLTPPKPPVFARGYPPYYPRGTARIQSVRSVYKPHARVEIQIKDVRPSYYDNTVYQAWLYDEDTGYMFNLGIFQAIEGNNAKTRYWGSHYFDAYEYVIITREPYNDIDPRPSDDEILIGKLPQKQYYEPKPVLDSRARYGYTYYYE